MNYSLGLDIGITSVGWAVLDLNNKQIADLGVRLFTGAENSKTGASLALPRREARSTRRRIRRKRQRMTAVRNLLVSEGLLSPQQMQSLYEKPSLLTPWQLRAEGLDRLLTEEEWVRVLLHLVKHRGFKSNRKNQQDTKSEDGRVLTGIKTNTKLLTEGNGGKGYRTVGEMLQLDPKFEAHKRNKGGDYSNTLLRSDVIDEVKKLFEAQRGFGNPYAAERLQEEYLATLARQLPFTTGEMILKMTGRCKLEPEEIRAPKASWSAERFILLSKLANLRIRIDGKKTSLSPENLKLIEKLAYSNTKVTYKQIRAAIEINDSWNFDYIPGSFEKGKDPEEAVFVELKAFHSFRKAIEKALGKEYWNNLKAAGPQILDELACALTYWKTDDEIKGYLKSKEVPDELAEAISTLSFNGNVNLSLKAMRKLIPCMEEKFCGYDEACVLAGYCHYDPGKNGRNRSRLLPVPDWEEIRNPVVIRSVSQTRKVVNAIIRKYGSPTRIQIEMARDIALNRKDRDAIEKKQDKNRNERARLSEEFEKTYGLRPNGRELEKYRLWKEQSGFCPYSGTYLDPDETFRGNDGTYAEIDHIIPYSRCFDDSFNNKVLVTGSENRNKKNRTPYEYLGGDEQSWEEFKARVECNVKNRRKAARLTITGFDEKEAAEMKERSLNDTRYINRYVAAWIENNLQFEDERINNPVVRLNGQATAQLRHFWGINALKDRDKNDLHHALDACVIAAATPSIIKAISDYSASRESFVSYKNEQGAVLTRCPEPWPKFRKEVAARISDNPAEAICNSELCSYTEAQLEALRPIFVSRAPRRGVKGPAHDQTIRSAKYLHTPNEEGKTGTISKVALNKLSLNPANAGYIGNMIGKERDKRLYEALKERLLKFAKDEKNAFIEEFHKPLKDGTPGPLVKSVKIFNSGTSGVEVCHGVAGNNSMVRVDVYIKDGKYYLVPYYVADIAAKNIKVKKAIVANKPESEWQEITDDFKFLLSLHYNDLVRVIDSKGQEIFGYYYGTNINTGAISILSHSGETNKTGIGMRTAKLIEKYEVDVLGSYHKVKKEKPPHGLA